MGILDVFQRFGKDNVGDVWRRLEVLDVRVEDNDPVPNPSLMDSFPGFPEKRRRDVDSNACRAGVLRCPVDEVVSVVASKLKDVRRVVDVDPVHPVLRVFHRLCWTLTKLVIE